MDDEERRVGTLGQDPDLAAPGEGETSTQLDNVLAKLQAAIEAKVETSAFAVGVSARPGVTIRYLPDIDDEKMTAWRNRAKDRKAPDGINAMRFMCIVIANCTQAIGFDDQYPNDETTGQPLTFASPWIKRLVAVPQNGRATDGVRPLIANDAHVLLHGNEILMRAGYDDDVVEVDGGPTTAS